LLSTRRRIQLIAASLLMPACFFDGGSSELLAGAVQKGALCMVAPVDPRACPSCSTPDGAVCRDLWYSSALRCSTDAQCGGAPGGCQLGYCVTSDADGDGLDDALEREVAERNFPALRLAGDEGCGQPSGVIYRVRRHPGAARRLAITYVVLYNQDCGELNGHLGDDEAFAITVDLDASPGVDATVGVAAWAHAGTSCGSTSSCETSAGTAACGNTPQPGGTPQVRVFSSRNKHANYLSTDTCASNCFDSCDPAGPLWTGAMVNVGEPGRPMVSDLTQDGFIQSQSGWDKRLLHANPWSPTDFGGAGRVDRQLTALIAPSGK
jgi:hypothetical protein